MRACYAVALTSLRRLKSYLMQASKLPETPPQPSWGRFWKGSRPWILNSRHIDTAQSSSICKGSPCGEEAAALGVGKLAGLEHSNGSWDASPAAFCLLASLLNRLRWVAQHH